MSEAASWLERITAVLNNAWAWFWNLSLQDKGEVILFVTLFIGFVRWLYKRRMDRRTAEQQARQAKQAIKLVAKHRTGRGDGHSTTRRAREERILSLHYTNQKDDFVGRNELLKKMLDGFLDIDRRFSEQNAFRWALVYGEAGTGKSRFALELLRAGERKLKGMIGRVLDALFKRTRTTPETWGFFVRNAGESPYLTVEQIAAWVIEEPAVVVLDYAGSTRHLNDVIIRLAERAVELRQPIRLLLLDRRNSGGGFSFSDLHKLGALYDPRLSDTYFEIEDKHNDDSVGIELMPLSDANAVRIMRNRIENDGDLSDDYLLKRLDEFDRGKRRPLFAAMVGSALANREFIDDDEDERDSILDFLVKRDRKRYWRSSRSGEAAPQLAQHENLLALSTFCRGLEETVLDEGGENCLARIPDRSSYDADLYLYMASSGERDDSDGLDIGWLEPDFIGEWFVLQRLSPPRSRRDEISRPTPDQRAFLEMGWRHGQESAAQFVRQCHQNHSNAVISLDYLLPAAGEHLDHVSALIRDLLSDWRHELGRVWAVTKSKLVTDDHQHIGRAAEKAFRLLRQHVDAAADKSPVACANIAEATENYAYVQSWLLSPSLRERADHRFVADADDDRIKRINYKLKETYQSRAEQEPQRSGEAGDDADSDAASAAAPSDGALPAPVRDALRLWEKQNRQATRHPQFHNRSAHDAQAGEA